MNGHTNHTPCGGDPEAAIIALERRALERWNQGDPDGFLELTSGDVVYFDPALGRKLIGKKALGELNSHAERGAKNHPKKRARASVNDGGGHSDDVA